MTWPCQLPGAPSVVTAECGPPQYRFAREQCPTCPNQARCLQSAADAPFEAVGVWGGLVLPDEQDQLPAPTQQPTYDITRYHLPSPSNPKGAGRSPWWQHLGKNYTPSAGRSSSTRSPLTGD